MSFDFDNSLVGGINRKGMTFDNIREGMKSNVALFLAVLDKPEIRKRFSQTELEGTARNFFHNYSFDSSVVLKIFAAIEYRLPGTIPKGQGLLERIDNNEVYGLNTKSYTDVGLFGWIAPSPTPPPLSPTPPITDEIPDLNHATFFATPDSAREQSNKSPIPGQVTASPGSASSSSLSPDANTSFVVAESVPSTPGITPITSPMLTPSR